MKRYLFLATLLLSSLKGFSQQQYNVFMDSIGVVHTSTLRTPQVAISGYFSNLLYLPNTLAGYGITDAVPASRTLTINGVSQDLSANRTFTIAPYTAGSGISLAGNIISNTAPDQIVSITAGNGIQISGTYPNFTISLVQPTITTPTRALNTSFTVNSTKSAVVFYTITCQVTNPLVVGTSSATCVLQYSTNGGSTWTNASSIANSSGVGVTVTVQLTNGQTGVVGGIIPANALVKLATTVTGTGTVTLVSSQEVVY